VRARGPHGPRSLAGHLECLEWAAAAAVPVSRHPRYV